MYKHAKSFRHGFSKLHALKWLTTLPRQNRQYLEEIISIDVEAIQWLSFCTDRIRSGIENKQEQSGQQAYQTEYVHMKKKPQHNETWFKKKKKTIFILPEYSEEPTIPRTYQTEQLGLFYLKQRGQYQPAASEHSMFPLHLVQNLGCARISWISASYLTLCWIFVMEWISSFETPRLTRFLSKAMLRIIFLPIIFWLVMLRFAFSFFSWCVCSFVVWCFGWVECGKCRITWTRVYISTWDELGNSGWNLQKAHLGKRA